DPPAGGSRQAAHDDRHHRILLRPGAKRGLDLVREVRRRPAFGAVEESRHRDLVEQPGAELHRRLDELPGFVLGEAPLEIFLGQELEAFFVHAFAPSAMQRRNVSRTRKSVVATQEADWLSRWATSSTLRCSW